MIRGALAVYLMLMAAVGPRACCCTTVRLAARLFSSARPTAPSCCQNKAAAGREKQAPTHCPSRPHSPSRPGCPCKEGSVFEVGALPPSPEDTAGASGRPIAGERLLPTALPANGLSLHPGGPAACPVLPAGAFLSTHDLLCVHHVMRC
jgi:hypothetical protein